jgi:ankyrin repeat protein
VGIVKFLIGRGCNVNIRNPEALTLLCLAVIHGDANLVRTLLSRDARQDRRHVATTHSPIMHIQGFDDSPDAKDDMLMPPLIRVVHRGHTDLVKLLVVHGANINVEYREGIEELPTWAIGGPLASAEQLGDQETAKILRGQGAKRDVGMVVCAVRRLDVQHAISINKKI